ncbi:MAG: GNAT family N-acetyltransferase [Anaerolineae bacterium]|nr:GNAT family N-acetyltransferase [Anaerolineae bacterium]
MNEPTSTDTNKPRRKRITIRQAEAADIPNLIQCHKAVYGDLYEDAELYGKRKYELQLSAFPQGQVIAELDGQIVGYTTSLIVQLDDEDHWYTYSEITGSGTFSTHTPSGDTLYGADIAVHPDFRQRGISKRLYKKRLQLLKKYNLRRMVAHGRIPDYYRVSGKMTAEEYVRRVEAGDMWDSALKAHLSAGYHVKRLLLDYVEDEQSLNYATWLEMPNPDFQSEKRKIAAAPIKRPVRAIRVCAAQWLMRKINSWEEFEQMVTFFVMSADSYHCHFLILPELFTVNLFSLLPPDITPKEAAWNLAGYHEKYVALFTHLAQKYRLYIVGGSTPVEREGLLYNVAHLFSPSGNVYTQDKLHVTPYERAFWDIQPGESLKVFETPWARIAIQICYDIEFPETSRLLALAGAEAIFVPFSTDEKKAYYRVRYAAHARAVENYMYLALAGNAGNLPTTPSYLLNYSQSAILTPSDFAFPLEATAALADPNTETVVIADLDLNALAQQRELGSVRPLQDRRPDLYELRAKIPIKTVYVE